MGSFDSSYRGTCQNPLLASNLLWYFSWGVRVVLHLLFKQILYSSPRVPNPENTFGNWLFTSRG